MTTAKNDINKRIQELTKALETKSARLNDISNTVIDETGKGHMVISTEAHADYQKTLGEAREIKSLIEEQKAHLDIERFPRRAERAQLCGPGRRPDRARQAVQVPV
ncbi:hypothetical protein AB0L44_16650 [Nonomuraea wenchangensis]|uniref:hypothetical protein n=1 Tax=Nonomuraea wenchangensis TaxID=568860 RepID=UPI00341C3607